jgi:hypothetical protein
MINLYNNLTDGNNGIPPTPGGTWTYVGTGSTGLPPNPPAPPASYNDDIDMSGVDEADAGTYIYRYTVTDGICTSIADVDVSKFTHTYVSNNECSSARNLAFPYTGGGAATVDTQDLSYNCPGQAAPTLSGVSIPMQWGTQTYTGDLWYKLSWDATYPAPLPSTMAITVNGVPYGNEGVYEPAIALYDACGGSLIDADLGPSNLQQCDLIVNGIFGSSFTYYIRVAALEGKEGKYDISITV